MTGTNLKSLRIAIVGSGMGGLATALALAKKGFTDVHVYEQAPDLGFVGAGIQLAPNMARILDRFGVWEELKGTATECKNTSIRQGSTDQELSHVDLANVEQLYGYPHMVAHRADLARALYDGCKAHPGHVHFHFNTSITAVTSWSPPTLSVTQSGSSTTITADILLACDGIKSKIRDAMLRDLCISAKIIDTAQAAYRIMLTRAQLSSDPELLALLDSDTVTRWIGQSRHIIAYSVANKSIYNLSTAQPDTHFAAAPSATYTTRGDKRVMLDVYADFCPKIQKLLSLVPDGEVVEWKLRVHEPLPTWHHGFTALVGDAAHPTLPHLAQGAAQAIEDGAALGEVLGALPDASQQSVEKAWMAYEAVRRERAYALVEMAAESGRGLHLGEGKAREERDRAFKEGKGPNPDKWADRDVQRGIYGFDCMAEARAAAEKVFGT